MTHDTISRASTGARAARGGRLLLRSFPRLMGAITVVYAVYVLVSPEAMTSPIALSGDEPDAGLALLTRGMLARDLACGLAMMLVPAGWPLGTAIAIRVASDLSDALIMGTGLPTAEARTSAVLVAGTFGLLCALSAFGARREGA